MRYIFTILMAIILSACATNQTITDTKISPTLKMNGIEISGIGLDSIDFNIDVTIANTYPIDINLSDIMINIYYQDKIINSNNIIGALQLESRSLNNITLDSSLSTLDLIKIIKDYKSVEYLPFKIEVVFTFPLPKTLNMLDGYRLKDSISINIPTISPQFSLKSLEFQTPFNIKAVFNIKNDTKSTFSLDDINYNINLNDKYFSGVAKSIKNDDGSFDIIIDDLDLFSIGTSALKDITDIDLEIKSAIELGEIPYKIPLYLKKEF